MELTSIEFTDFVKIAQVLWIKGVDAVDNAMLNSGIVRRMDIPENTGNKREFSEIETNRYLHKKSEGDQAKRAKIQQGYSKTMTKYRVAENVGITYEMRKENKYPEVIAALTDAGKKGPETMDLDMTHRFTFGTATSYTDRDGDTIDTATGDTFQLFYTAHTLKGSSTTYRNRLANNPALSKGAMEAMEKLIVEETYNNLGEKMTATFDKLFTSDDPNTVNTAREYLRSTASPDANHAGVVNVYAGKYQHIILPRLATTATGAPDSTKAKYWGLVSTALSSFYLGVWEQPHMIAPTVGSNGEDVQTDDWDFRVRAGYGMCVVGSTWVKMSSGDATA
jgi:hypothetical protein